MLKTAALRREFICTYRFSRLQEENNMAEEFNIEKLREEVNPVYSTAHSCLQLLAAIGDQDSDVLRKTLGFTVFGADTKERGANVPPQILGALMKALPVFNSLPEARFFSSNNFIRACGAGQVVDLPCGYTARGIKMAGSGLKYYGLDLPAVIDAMGPAVEKVIGKNENISYHEVDATNYASLRKALEGAEGELIITTEGLLMYLTQAEVETVFGNIRRLLLEFGGKWITVDNELVKAEKAALAAVTTGMPQALAEKLGTITAGSVAKTTLNNNIFFDPDPEKARKFVSDMGFELELVPMSRYMPETIAAYKPLAEDLRAKCMEALGAVNFWVMTAKSGGSERFSCEEKGFRADVQLMDEILSVSLTGRLDTITSPSLLALYKEAAAKGKIRSICVDMKNLEYISSAGLRVMLIMRKALENNQNIHLINMNDTVREIIETTGFDTVFC